MLHALRSRHAELANFLLRCWRENLMYWWCVRWMCFYMLYTHIYSRLFFCFCFVVSASVRIDVGVWFTLFLPRAKSAPDRRRSALPLCSAIAGMHFKASAQPIRQPTQCVSVYTYAFYIVRTIYFTHALCAKLRALLAKCKKQECCHGRCAQSVLVFLHLSQDIRVLLRYKPSF